MSQNTEQEQGLSKVWVDRLLSDLQGKLGIRDIEISVLRIENEDLRNNVNDLNGRIYELIEQLRDATLTQDVEEISEVSDTDYTGDVSTG